MVLHLVLAHPLTEPGGLGLPPLVTASIVLAVVGLAWRLPRRPITPEEPLDSRTGEAHPEGGRSAGRLLARAAAVGTLVLVVVAGRFGRDSQIDNVAPALAIGVAWPLVLLDCLAGGVGWRAANPFAALAGVLDRLSGGTRRSGAVAGGRWWAVVPTLLWVAYLGIVPDALEPRVVGAVVGLYTVATLAACLAVGPRWLHAGEVFTVLTDICREHRRDDVLLGSGSGSGLRGGVSPTGSGDGPPVAGSGALAAVWLGGLAFALLRPSPAWTGPVLSLGLAPFTPLTDVVGLVASIAVAALTVRGAAAWSARTGSRRDRVVTAAVVVAVGLGLAIALARERFVKAVILVVARLGNPLGGPGDPFGLAGLRPANTILGPEATVLLQMALIALAAVLAGRASRHSPVATPTRVLVSAWTGLAVLLLTIA